MRWRPLAIALLVQAALLLWRLDRLPVWGDEQFTLDVVALPWGDIAETLRRDIHPPLYFALAKLWAALPLWGSEIVQLRAFSALTMLGATVALDRLILAQRTETLRRWTLAAWALSPAVVLYGRMARSYALQTLMAVVALYAVSRLLAAPSWKRSLLAGLALAALLYTHYLPGLAVAAGLAAAALWTRRISPAAAALGTAALVYLPWVAVLAEGLVRAARKPVYTVTGSWLVELPLRAGYTVLGLFAGEAYTASTFGCGLLLSLALCLALMRGWLGDGLGLRTLLTTAAIVGFIGAAQWVSFPFMPARLLWLLPWLLVLTVTGVHSFSRDRARVWLGVWLGLAGVGQLFLAQQKGYLNKGYLIPFEEIAQQAPQGLLLADATNCDPSPLRAAVGRKRFRAITSPGDVEPALDAALAAGGPVWRVRASRDVTPERIQDALDRRLEAAGFGATTTSYLPYSDLDLMLLRAMGETDPPTHHLLLIRYERDDR